MVRPVTMQESTYLVQESLRLLEDTTPWRCSFRPRSGLLCMNTTKCSLRNVSTALFAPTGDRIYTTGQYLCGYAIASLERLFRVRGRIAPSCISTKPCADKLILAYADGHVDMRDGRHRQDS